MASTFQFRRDVLASIPSLVEGEIFYATDDDSWWYGDGSGNVQLAGGEPKHLCDGRLTLATGTPVTRTNQLNKTTLYFTPFKGDKVRLYDGTRWQVHTFSERSISTAAAGTGTRYVYLYDNAGTLTLDVSSTGYTTQNGIRVKSGDAARLFLGWLSLVSGGCYDAEHARFVINWYNAIPRHVLNSLFDDDNNIDSYSSANSTNWSAANAGSGTWIQYFSDGVHPVDVNVNANAAPGAGSGKFVAVGLGVDSSSTSQFENPAYPDTRTHGSHRHASILDEGLHTLYILERSNAVGTIYSDLNRNGGSSDPRGTFLSGHIWG